MPPPHCAAGWRQGRALRSLYPLTLLLALGSPAMAMDKSAYQLTLDARVENRKLTMAPHIRAPAGSALRYEMVAAKSGASGNTSTRQGGQVRVDDSQTAALSKVSLSLDPDSRCTVSIKVFEGATLVAEGAFTYPDAAPR